MSAPRPVRGFAVRHARALERVWLGVERALVRAAPALARIGWDRLERPVAAAERALKGALFGCRMCGDCVLSATGMSCPMICPKSLRNGPCGGVRADGGCEIRPAMLCVWIAARRGAATMRGGARIRERLPALDHRLAGRSSWLAVARGSLGAAA